ncbi:MAG: glycosyltransferase family 1 protein [bacterium]
MLDDGLFSRGKKSGIGHHVVNLFESLEPIADCTIASHDAIFQLPRFVRKWGYIFASNNPSQYTGYDLIHHLGNYIPRARGEGKHVMTVYDFSMLRYPETIPITWRHFNQHSFRNSIERADGLITISSAMRDELMETFPRISHSQVYVCPPGLRNTMQASGRLSSGIHELGLAPFSYFLFVGDLTRRKNIEFLLRTFIAAKKQHRLNEETLLVLVGKKAWGYGDFSHLISEENGIRIIGYLADDKIAELYSHCKALLYPSVYEGFGIPIVEAMAQGAIIIASDIPTTRELHETHNRQSFLFKLGATEDLVGLLEMVEQRGSTIRQTLNYGDLSVYTYEKIARAHLEIYRKLCEGTS